MTNPLTTQQHLFVCLGEEGAEIAQRCAKLIRFGPDEVQPGQHLTNRDRVMVEVDDLRVILRMLEARGYIDPQDNPDHMAQKERRVLAMMELARREGQLLDDDPLGGRAVCQPNSDRVAALQR